MKFNWDGFTKENFTKYKLNMENSTCTEDDYIGAVRVGDLCFDILTRHDGTFNYGLDYDLYVGNVDTGYGYSNANGHNYYPYDYASGGTFEEPVNLMEYNMFQRYAESVFEAFINQMDECYTPCSLIAKANEELNVW